MLYSEVSTHYECFDCAEIFHDTKGYDKPPECDSLFGTDGSRENLPTHEHRAESLGS